MNEPMEMRPLYDNNKMGTQNGNGNTRPFIPASSQKIMIPGRSRFGSYQPTKGDKFILVATIVFNCFLLSLSCVMLGGGVWLIVIRGSYADLCSDNEWFEAVVCMLAVGSLLLIFCILSFVAMCYKNSRLLMLFIVMLIFLFICEMAAGIYAFARREYIEDRFSACMKDAYQNEYMDDEFPHVTEAWDKVQDEFDCCGVESSLDYFGNNKMNGAPKSCGGTQGDAEGKKPCYPVIKQRVLDENFYLIGGAAVGIAFIQIFAIIFNGLLLRIYHTREEYE